MNQRSFMPDLPEFKRMANGVEDDIEQKLDEADRAAKASDIRYTHSEVFSRLKDNLKG